MTEDWYFCSHRLPVARAARDAGFEVLVATRVRRHGAHICDEEFGLRPIAWRRRGDGPVAHARALAAIARLYRAERPDIVHHVALKPVLFGGLATRLAFPTGATAPAQIAAVMGLGSSFAAQSASARLRRPALQLALRLAAAGGWVVVQNPEDRTALAGFGVGPERIALIRGSGVDVARFRPLPDPSGTENSHPITVAIVSRMLRSKGVLDAVVAVQRLRAAGSPVVLLLAGAADPDNPDSLTEEELRALTAQPGVEWLGRVDDVRTVWRRAAIALLPTTYGEGVPLSLLEAAACGRPIVATDVPGCREAVRAGETGLLVPPRDIDGLAAAIRQLADDPDRRRAMGEAGRARVTRDFAEEVVIRQTLALYRSALAQRSRAP